MCTVDSDHLAEALGQLRGPLVVNLPGFHSLEVKDDEDGLRVLLHVGCSSIRDQGAASVLKATAALVADILKCQYGIAIPVKPFVDSALE